MSAAVWAETEPYDPHARLRAVRVEGDPLRSPRDSVRLVVWGATPEDRHYAEQDARTDQRVSRYRIAEVVQAEEPTLASDDSTAVARRVAYDRTWAAYRVSDSSPEAQRV